MEVAIAKIFYYRACGYFGVDARKQLRTQVTTSWLVERGLVLSATQRKRIGMVTFIEPVRFQRVAPASARPWVFRRDPDSQPETSGRRDGANL